MTHPDLFGKDSRPPLAMLREQPAPVALDLFETAAEHRALRTGRSKSQERAELVSPPPTCPIHGCLLLLEAGTHGARSCPRCA